MRRPIEALKERGFTREALEWKYGSTTPRSFKDAPEPLTNYLDVSERELPKLTWLLQLCLQPSSCWSAVGSCKSGMVICKDCTLFTQLKWFKFTFTSTDGVTILGQKLRTLSQDWVIFSQNVHDYRSRVIGTCINATFIHVPIKRDR